MWKHGSNFHEEKPSTGGHCVSSVLLYIRSVQTAYFICSDTDLVGLQDMPALFVVCLWTDSFFLSPIYVVRKTDKHTALYCGMTQNIQETFSSQN